MDMIDEIRRRYLVQKQTITDIAKDMGLSRPTVRKHLLTTEEPKYTRARSPAPRLDPFKAQLVDARLKPTSLAVRSRRSQFSSVWCGMFSILATDNADLLDLTKRTASCLNSDVYCALRCAAFVTCIYCSF